MRGTSAATGPRAARAGERDEDEAKEQDMRVFMRIPSQDTSPRKMTSSRVTHNQAPAGGGGRETHRTRAAFK